MDSFNPKPSSPWLPPPCSFFIFDVPNHGLEPPPFNVFKDFTFDMQENEDNDLFKLSVRNGQTEDDFFAANIDMDKIDECKEVNGGRVDGSGGGKRGKGKGKRKEKEKGENTKPQPMKRGRHCKLKIQPVNYSGGVVEPRKAMVAEELAQLWTIDPKRAKRIMANRQSAARSKERKAQHMLHLEENMKSLNSDVITLTTQIETFQRETAKLASERTELELRLKTMQYDNEIHDAQSEELQMEIIRLKTAITESDSSNREVSQIPLQQGMWNSSSRSFEDFPLLDLYQQYLSQLHTPPQTNYHMQIVDSMPLSELLLFFQDGISPEAEPKTNSGELFVKGGSFSTSLITGESSTISS